MSSYFQLPNDWRASWNDVSLTNMYLWIAELKGLI